MARPGIYSAPGFRGVVEREGRWIFIAVRTLIDMGQLSYEKALGHHLVSTNLRASWEPKSSATRGAQFPRVWDFLRMSKGGGLAEVTSPLSLQKAGVIN